MRKYLRKWWPLGIALGVFGLCGFAPQIDNFLLQLNRAGATVDRSTQGWTFAGPVTSTGLLTPTAGLVLPTGNVSLTSPTVTFNANSYKMFEVITLTSDANQTAFHPVGGTAGQTLIFLTGAGSNTIGVTDDATSMTIGGNITLTEGQGDVLALRCVAAPAYSTSGYGQWTALFAHDN